MDVTLTAKARDTQIVQLYAGGASINAIAEMLPTSRTTVWRALHAAGVAMRRRGPAIADQTITMPTDPGTLGYIAGLFDGEGNLYYRKHVGQSDRIKLAIYSTTAEVIEWLCQSMGGSIRWDEARVERHGWKPIGTWNLYRTRDVAAFLTALLPYLIIKRATAMEVLADPALCG